jgi:hypothetical protein
VIGANNASLQERPERFNIVRMNLAAHVLAASMMHGLMPDAATKIVVFLLFIGRYKRNFIADDLANEPLQVRASASPIILHTPLPLRSIAPITPTLP